MSHGWRMVTAGAIIQFFQAGLLHQGFGAYLAVLSEEFRWRKAELSGAAALQPLEAAFLGPVLGFIIDRFGPQGVIRTGIVILGAGFLVLSQIDSLAGFYAAFLLIALGSSLSGFFPLNVAIIHWFETQRARALSAISLGLALGGVLVPLVAWSMQHFGWRYTAFASGVLLILGGWPLARVFRAPKNRADEGQHVEAAGDPHRRARLPAPDYSAAAALRTRAFWLLGLGHGLALLVVYAVNVHAIAHMQDELGYSITQASFVIMLVTIAQVGGVLVGMAIGDRYEKRFIAAGCMLMHAAGLLMLTYAVNAAMLVAFALLHGSAWGIRGPFMQAIRADYFGRTAIGMILGLSSLIIVLGQVGGPILAGFLADLTGNYRMGFSVIAGLAAVGSLSFGLARKPTPGGAR